jgi:hypothetical protein
MGITYTRGQLLAEKIRLERRLQKGWDEIGRAEEEGRVADADRYFTVWLGVLRQYEDMCDQARARVQA